MSTTPKAAQVLSSVLTPGRSAEEMVEYYNNWADKYDEDCVGFRYNPPHYVAEALREIYQQETNIRILDCASGTGLVAEKLLQHGFTNIDALDPSEEMLHKAKLKDLYRNYICDFLGTNRLPIESGTHDAAITAGSFCEGHLKPDCLLEMTRVVKKGGHVFIGVTKEYLTEVEALRDLEPTMRHHEETGIWRMTSRTEVDNYISGKIGVIYVFQLL